MVQERAGSRRHRDLLAIPADIETIERLHRRASLAFDGAKTGEVVAAEQHLPGFVHRPGIKRPRHPPGAVALQHQGRPPVDDAIDIAPVRRRKPRMKVGGDFLRRHNHHRAVDRAAVA